MPIELIPIQPSHHAELGRICFDAFGALHDRHAVPRDFTDRHVADMVIAMSANRPDCYGVAATLDGKLVGSNFLMFADEVAGVGPITVDPHAQAHGVGKRLMQRVIDESRARGVRQLRLFQEAVNTASLSLYTSLGFDWRDAGAVMRIAPADRDDPRVRPMTVNDLPAIKALSIEHYGFSRANDTRVLLAAPMPAFVYESSSKIAGYFIPTFIGHAAADSPEILLALMRSAARHIPPPMAAFICPMSRPDFFRTALKAGFKTVKVMNYMSCDDYTPPPGNFAPSILC